MNQPPDVCAKLREKDTRKNDIWHFPKIGEDPPKTHR